MTSREQRPGIEIAVPVREAMWSIPYVVEPWSALENNERFKTTVTATTEVCGGTNRCTYQANCCTMPTARLFEYSVWSNTVPGHSRPGGGLHACHKQLAHRKLRDRRNPCCRAPARPNAVSGNAERRKICRSLPLGTYNTERMYADL